MHKKSRMLHCFIKPAKSLIWRLGNARRGLPGYCQFSSLLWKLFICMNYNAIFIKWFFFFFQGTSVSLQYRVDDAYLMSCSILLVSLFSMCGPICYLLRTNNPDSYWELFISSQTFFFWFHYHVEKHHRSLLSTLWYQGRLHGKLQKTVISLSVD